MILLYRKFYPWEAAMLNQQIRTLRLSRKMSQVELAKALNVTKQSVSNLENDNIQPSVDMLVKISKAFSVSTDYLLGLAPGEYVDVSGLPKHIVFHSQQVADDFGSSGK